MRTIRVLCAVSVLAYLSACSATSVQLATPAATATITASPTLTSTATTTPTITPTAIGSGGGLIAYISNQSKVSNIYTVSLQDKEIVQITDINDTGWPSWSPDGKRLAYMEYGRSGGIFIVDASGSNLEKFAEGNQDSVPVWSPDSDRIALFNTSAGHWALYTGTVGQNALKKLTDNTVFESVASWSPDGTALAYTLWPATVYPPDIWVVNADGTDARVIAESDSSDRYPVWSPDGSKISFISGRSGETAQIFVVNPDGTGLLQLTDTEGGNAYVGWSPDGAKIAFSSMRDELDKENCAQQGICNFEIYLMNADGSDQVRITNDPGSDIEPVWSSDGEWIAFSSNRDGSSHIYIMRPDGSELQQLTSGDGYDYYPLWQPQGATSP